MTLSAKQRAEINRLFYVEHFSYNAIAETLGIHHDTVKNLLTPGEVGANAVRPPKIIEPYLPFIDQCLEKYPKLHATRIARMLHDRGFKGSMTTVRNAVREIRPRYSPAFLPLTMIEGEQAQVDWAHFGRMAVENTKRKLYCFVMVLSFCRAIFARFTYDQRLASFLRCHVFGFHYLGGIARTLLYDNLKSVVLERDGRDIRFNPDFLEFSGHYRFEPKACNPRAGWEKGRVERAIRFIRNGFFYGRSFQNIDDLNEQLMRWLDDEANRRSWPDDRSVSVFDKWQEEKPRLLSLPQHDYPTETTESLNSRKLPYIRFDLNDYSIPHHYVRKPVTVIASDNEIRIVDKDQEIARHKRSFGKGNRVRCEAHFTALLEEKKRAWRQNKQEQLCTQIPEMEEFFLKATETGAPLGAYTKKLILLRDEFGIEKLREAVIEALANNMARVTVVAHILTQKLQRDFETNHDTTPILPERSQVRDLISALPDLSEYDLLTTHNKDTDQ